jgi:anti-sigma regulatory factor (Ser/Thr protein kinase)
MLRSSVKTPTRGARVSMVLPRDPYIFTLALKPVPQAATLARQTVTEAFQYWGYDEESVDAGRVVANELVTNAIAVSTEEQEITLRTFLGDDGLPVIEVWDDIDEEPTLREPGEDDVSGRGLILVEALAKRWGTNPVVGGGKVVWAVL